MFDRGPFINRTSQRKSWLNSRAQEKRLKNGKKTVEPQQNNKLIVQLLDFLEERTKLTTQEWRSRNTLSIHVQSLLEQQKAY